MTILPSTFKLNEKNPKEWSQSQACPKCEAVISKPFPGIAEEETRQGSRSAEAEDEQDDEGNDQAEKTKRPFPQEKGNDHNERAIHGPKENGRRERIDEKIVARGMVNGRLHSLVHAPLPEGPDH